MLTNMILAQVGLDLVTIEGHSGLPAGMSIRLIAHSFSIHVTKPPLVLFQRIWKYIQPASQTTDQPRTSKPSFSTCMVV